MESATKARPELQRRLLSDSTTSKETNVEVFFWGREGVSDFVLGWLVILYSVGFGGGGVNDF